MTIYCEREDLERVARYIIRNPFSTEKMEFRPPNAVSKDGSVICRSGMNPKIHRNFQIFTLCDFIAAITQHIPDKSFQLVRYDGWYSNKMRGQRDKQALEAAKAASNAIQIIDVSEHQPFPDCDTEPVPVHSLFGIRMGVGFGVGIGIEPGGRAIRG